MLILLLAVGSMNIACKITIFLIFTQATHFTEMQGAIESKYKGRLLYLPDKRNNQPYFMSVLFYVSQYFYTPNIPI
jgi:hypothetical protein